MNLPRVTAEEAMLLGWALFTVSELLAVSRFKENAVVEVLLRCLSLLLPYEVTRKETRGPARDPRGRYTAKKRAPRAQ